VDTTDGNIIRHMGIACWISKALGTLRLCNIYCFSSEKMVSRKRFIFTFIRLVNPYPANVENRVSS
jgi:hypothetical protein